MFAGHTKRKRERQSTNGEIGASGLMRGTRPGEPGRQTAGASSRTPHEVWSPANEPNGGQVVKQGCRASARRAVPHEKVGPRKRSLARRARIDATCAPTDLRKMHGGRD